MSLAPLVQHLVSEIVSEPEVVTVEQSADRDGTTYFVKVAPTDVGKVIGKSGRVVSCIRYVVSAAAAKNRHKAYVKVITD
jgi:predicted RNA-binding protein YlqC (UPF0109 family)